MLQRYDRSRNCDLMSALAARFGVNERQAAFVREYVRTGVSGLSALTAGYSAEGDGFRLLRLPNVIAAVHAEVQRLLVSDAAPKAFRTLAHMLEADSTPPGVKADIAVKLMKMAGHVQPTNRDKDPEKQISDMSREEMIAYIDRNQAEIDKAVDELASRAKEVSASFSAQDVTPVPLKPLDYLG